jgi:hypothetical protein
MNLAVLRSHGELLNGHPFRNGGENFEKAPLTLLLIFSAPMNSFPNTHPSCNVFLS